MTIVCNNQNKSSSFFWHICSVKNKCGSGTDQLQMPTMNLKLFATYK